MSRVSAGEGFMGVRTKSGLVVISAAALLLAGCTGAEGDETPPGPTEDGTTEETTAPPDPEENRDEQEPAGAATLGEWVELPARTYFVTATADLALLATGDQSFGQVITRDVTVVDAEGQEVWTHPDVREMHNLPEAASAGQHVVLIDADRESATVRGLTWAEGNQVWEQPVAELFPCTEQVSVRSATADSVLLDSLGEPCAGTESRAVAASIDAATGEVRGRVEATGNVTGVSSADGAQAWFWQMDGDQVQVHHLEPDTGQVVTDVIEFDAETRAALTDGDIEMISMWPVSDHQVALQSWRSVASSVLALADFETGQARLYPEGEPCGHFTASRDVASRTCVIQDPDTEFGIAYDFDGNELWTTEGSIGLTLDGGVPVEAVQVGGERAWLVSVGEDLIQARAVATGSQLWAAGVGEGSGAPSSRQIPGTDVVVLGIQHDPPATGLLRLDATTGAELERLDLTDAWVHGDGHAIAVHADEVTLLAFPTSG
ncbi:hypothetical protein [Pseudactinotalea sp. Z1748]|uniref:hypothetical protein n=1 Tax=Pseudactinotalea sp. Z1748 TaxID=3413027 RepID=UPI003C7D70EA